MSEHSPIPWTLDTTLCVVWDRNKRCVLRWESGSQAEWIAEMEFIVKCVNLHDELVAGCQTGLDEILAWADSEGWYDKVDKDASVIQLRALLAKANQ